ncbi:MAG: hypothetical protein ACRYF3_10335 [Janthinobacterium lividum]
MQPIATMLAAAVCGGSDSTPARRHLAGTARRLTRLRPVDGTTHVSCGGVQSAAAPAYFIGTVLMTPA